MFNVISWDTFFAGVALIVGSYYFITGALLYRDEIKQWLVSSRQTNASSSSSALAEPSGIMGSAQPEAAMMPRTSTVAVVDLAVVEDREPGEQVGAAPDRERLDASTRWQEIDTLLEEVRTVLQAVVASNVPREDCASLMTTLFGRYPHLKETSYRESVAFYVLQLTRDTLSYQLSLQEVLYWWAN